MTPRALLSMVILFSAAWAGAQESATPPAAPPPAPAVAPAALGQPDLKRILDNRGAEALGNACHENADASNDPQCKILARLCGTAEAAKFAACVAFSGAKLLEVPIVEIPNPNQLPDEVTSALDACEKDSQCATLADIETISRKAVITLQAWCAGRDLLGANAQDWISIPGRKVIDKVCSNALTNNLSSVGLYELKLLRTETGRVKLNCNGFGLVTPFFSFRKPGNGDVKVQAFSGLGAGHYWAAQCSEEWSWGFDVFGYSEGINLSERSMHLGLGASVGISAAKFFKFGFGIGHDIYRQSVSPSGDITRSGFIAAKGLGAPSINYLVTFTILANGSGAKEEKAKEQ